MRCMAINKANILDLKFANKMHWKMVLFASSGVNLLNAELNPICYLLALVEAHHILHVSRVKVKAETGSQSTVPLDGNSLTPCTWS